MNAAHWGSAIIIFPGYMNTAHRGCVIVYILFSYYKLMIHFYGTVPPNKIYGTKISVLGDYPKIGARGHTNTLLQPFGKCEGNAEVCGLSLGGNTIR